MARLQPFVFFLQQAIPDREIVPPLEGMAALSRPVG